MGHYWNLILFSELGVGWEVARFNDQAELDFVRKAQRGWTDDRGYDIGGTTLINYFPQDIDFSQYNPNGSKYNNIISLLQF